MGRMLTRRMFGRLSAAVAVTPVSVLGERVMLGAGGAEAGVAPEGGARFSVMLWALKSRGGFEENLERVAQAGYGHVELVGEFSGWSEADWVRILARMKELGLTVDATSGMKLGFADPAGGDAFLAELGAKVS